MSPYHIYLKENYFLRLLVSYLTASIVVCLLLFLLPENFDTVKEKRFLIIPISLYSELPVKEDAGGSGSGTSFRLASEELELKGIPVPSVSADVEATNAKITSAMTSPNAQDSIASGFGDGIGFGLGNGVGNGIGDGTGNGIQGTDTIPPRPILQVMPQYPKDERKVSGKIQLLVKVNASGRVESVIVASNTTDNPAFEKTAIDAAYASRYRPARYNKIDVPAWTSCEYVFREE